MTRKLKALGLSLLALLAASAVASSAAQAGEFTAENYPATITGQQIGFHELATELGTMECKAQFHGELAAASEDLTLTPTYGTNCKIAGLTVHVNLNGCDYLFHAGNTLEMDAVEGSLDIKCPEGNEIDFEITSMQVCHLTVPEQVGLNDVVYTTRTMAHDVDLDLDVEGLAYGLDAGCPVMGTFANGTYVGESTLKGDFEGAGTAFGVH